MNSLTNRSVPNASGLTAGSRHQASTRAGRSARAIPSCRATTWAIAARTPTPAVRAAKNPARCAASCTLSEKAMTFRSSL